MKKNDAFRVSVTIPMSPQTTLSGVHFFLFTASKTHTEKKKKLHRINKVIKTTKKTNSEFTHLHGNILTNNKGIRARKALVKFLVVFLFCSDFPNMLHVD